MTKFLLFPLVLVGGSAIVAALLLGRCSEYLRGFVSWAIEKLLLAVAWLADDGTMRG